MEKKFWVYIMASGTYGTLYIGMTSNLMKRVWEHKHGKVEGFTKKYEVDRLVWWEMHENAESAINREKRIKEWQRDWKINLIERTNPHWSDLLGEIEMA